MKVMDFVMNQFAWKAVSSETVVSTMIIDVTEGLEVPHGWKNGQINFQKQLIV